MAKVKVYGADWCGDTRRALSHLDGLEVEYDYIDVEADAEASQWVKDQNNGKEIKPTLDIDGAVVSNPSDDELEAALKEHGVIA